MLRYEIIGEWSGPQNPAGNYTRWVHREVTKDRYVYEAVRDWLHCIRYCDGTCLYLTARQLNKGERTGDQRLSYESLIRDCIRHKVTSVDALIDAKQKITA